MDVLRSASGVGRHVRYLQLVGGSRSSLAMGRWWAAAAIVKLAPCLPSLACLEFVDVTLNNFSDLTRSCLSQMSSVSALILTLVEFENIDEFHLLVTSFPSLRRLGCHRLALWRPRDRSLRSYTRMNLESVELDHSWVLLPWVAQACHTLGSLDVGKIIGTAEDLSWVFCALRANGSTLRNVTSSCWYCGNSQCRPVLLLVSTSTDLPPLISRPACLGGPALHHRPSVHSQNCC